MRVVDGVRSFDPAVSATDYYAVSDEGTLVYQPSYGAAQTTLAMVPLDGS